MPGYDTVSDYAGVLSASYFFKMLFEKVKKVKFVIIIDESKLYE